MATEHTPATGTHTTNGTPIGYSSITPFLALTDPAGAIDFYTRVFGAEVIGVSEFQGIIAHADLAFPFGRLHLGMALSDFNLFAPDPDAEAVAFSLMVYCPNVDEIAERAMANGAHILEPLSTFVSGDRYVTFRDPYGIRWNVRTRVEDLSDTESQRRVDEWLANQG